MTTTIDHEVAITTWLADNNVTTAKAHYVGVGGVLDKVIEVSLRPTCGERPMLAAFAAIAANDPFAAVTAKRRHSGRRHYLEMDIETEVEGRRVLVCATFSPGDGDEHILLDQTLPDWASVPLTPFHLRAVADPDTTAVVVGSDGLPTVRMARTARAHNTPTVAQIKSEIRAEDNATTDPLAQLAAAGTDISDGLLAEVELDDMCPGCGEDPDGGDGWDGYCASCADRAEAQTS